ncbi:tetratricopeptide repeat protein [Zhongshania borealis]|uniref:Tetratricopeptide repeat protein n=1 Tax=Zhongshania borealis TaxID=889488 RepID=A0ABP7W6C1_9GAMM
MSDFKGNDTQREIRVFLSSTFKDMNKERNYLVQHVFPEVRQKCIERGVGFTEIDLRWGITEEATKNGETTAICLREIDRCRDFPPFFIGFLGERYGWIPHESDLAKYLLAREDDEHYRVIKDGLDQGISVTELEIQHGVLNNDAQGIFYFRDRALTEAIFQDAKKKAKKEFIEGRLAILKSKFRRPGSVNLGDYTYYKDDRANVFKYFFDPAADHLEDLKQTIRGSRSGKLKLDGYTSVEEFGNDVKQELLSALDERYPKENLSPLELLLLQQQNFAASRLQAYVPLLPARQAILDYYDLYQSGEEKRNLLITGESGLGKSAFMADFARFFPQELGSDNVRVVDLYAGIEGCSSLAQWRDNVLSVLGLSDGEPKAKLAMGVEKSGEDQRWDQFTEQLQSWCSDHTGQTLVLLLDAANQLLDSNSALQRLQGLRWPRGCVCIVSSTPQEYASPLWYEHSLQTLTDEQRETLINDYFSKYSKELPSGQVHMLATHEACQSPLYLKVVLEQMRTYFTSHSLEKDIPRWLGCSDLVTLFTEVIVQLNDAMSDEAHPNLVSDLCGYLAVSRAGFDEHQLSILLAAESDSRDAGRIARLAPLKLAPVLAVLSPLMMRSQGRESLMHTSFVEAALKNTDEERVRLRIINCFGGEFAQALSERCYQYTQLAKMSPTADEYKKELVQLLGSIRDTSKVLSVDKGVLAESLLLLGARQESIWVRDLLTLWDAVPVEDVVSELEKLIDFCAEEYFPMVGVFLQESLVAFLRKNNELAEITTLAVHLNNLASLYCQQNKPDKALPLFTEALTIYRASLSAGHPAIAGSLNNLANLYQLQNESDKALRLYTEALESNRASLPVGHMDIATSLSNLANFYADKNEPGKALRLYTEALEIRQASLPLGHPTIADSLNNLATLYQQQGHTDKVLSLYTEALSIYRASLPAGHPDIAMSLGNLATFYADQNQPDKALRLYTEALEIRRASLPAGHPDIARSLNNLANLYYQQNEADKALQLYNEALEICRASLPFDHPDIAGSLNNLANIYFSRNQPDEALPLYTEALTIFRTNWPAGHLAIAGSLGNLASIYGSQGEPDKALPLYTEALAVYRASLPGDHPKLAKILSKLASFYSTQNQPDKALPLFKEALAIRRASLPAGHSAIAGSLAKLASVYDSQSQPDMALPLYAEALQIRVESLPAGHLEIGNSLNDLGRFYANQNLLDKALLLYREALAIHRASLPAGHRAIADSLNNLANVYDEQGQLDKALPLLTEALKIRVASLPAGHLDIASSLNKLAFLYDRINQPDKALPLYREGLKIYRASLPVGHPKIAINLSNLAGIYANQNQLDEAQPLYAEALEIERACLPAGDPDMAISLYNLACVFACQGDRDKALPLFTEVLEIYRVSLPSGHPKISMIEKSIANICT